MVTARAGGEYSVATSPTLVFGMHCASAMNEQSVGQLTVLLWKNFDN